MTGLLLANISGLTGAVALLILAVNLRRPAGTAPVVRPAWLNLVLLLVLLVVAGRVAGLFLH